MTLLHWALLLLASQLFAVFMMICVYIINGRIKISLSLQYCHGLGFYHFLLFGDIVKCRRWSIAGKISLYPVSFSPSFIVRWRDPDIHLGFFFFSVFDCFSFSLFLSSSRHPSSQEYHLAQLINGSLLFPHLLASS